MGSPPVTFENLGRWGRLGNQLWQVAGTVGLARREGLRPALPTGWAYRRFFSLPEDWYDDSPGIEAPTLAVELPEGDRPYLQSLNLWAGCEDEIREAFRPSAAAKRLLVAYRELAMLPRPVLSVHVRRGDNVQANDPLTPDKHLYHPLRPTSYYAEAIGDGRARGLAVAVFSDDPDWCVAELPGADYYHRGWPRPKEHEPGYDDTPLDWIDLFLMAGCSEHVISNSTYAWWGAWLAGNRVTYSWPWYGPRINADAALMMPPDWRRVEV